MSPPATLIVAFQRPQNVERLLSRLSVTPPSKVVLAVDGPRNHRERAVTLQVLGVAASCPWKGDVEIWEQESNLGLRRHMSDSISRFLTENGAGVILEEDCLPSPTFLPYAAHALQRYRDDSRVSMISGNRFGRSFPPDRPAVLSRHHHIWGWATWESRWTQHLGVLNRWGAVRDEVLLQTFPDDSCSQDFWRTRIDEVLDNDENSWAYRWTAANWALDRFAVLPGCNLVVNQGISGTTATHTKSVNSYIRRTPLGNWSGSEGTYAMPNADVDREINRRVFGACPSLHQRVTRSIRRELSDRTRGSR